MAKTTEEIINKGSKSEKLDRLIEILTRIEISLETTGSWLI